MRTFHISFFIHRKHYKLPEVPKVFMKTFKKDYLPYHPIIFMVILFNCICMVSDARTLNIESEEPFYVLSKDDRVFGVIPL